YCHDTRWVSDYHYNQLFARVQSDNRIAMAKNGGLLEPMYQATVEKDGTLSVSNVSDVGWVTKGIPREIEVGGRIETGYWFPYDHIPGGFMMVSGSVRTASKARLRL